jgi:hypothetical protein
MLPLDVKLLAIVAGIVVHALDGAAVGAHQPLGALEGVLAAEFQPLGILGFLGRPPPDLQVHHGVHDGVVAAHVPGGDQVGQRVVQLLQPGGGAQAAGAVFRVVRGFVGGHRRVVVQEAGVVILLVLVAQQTAGPQLGPLLVAVVLGIGVELPEFAGPEAAGPEVALLRVPLPGVGVAFGEEAESGALGVGCGVARGDHGLEALRGAVGGFLQEGDGLGVGAVRAGDWTGGRSACPADIWAGSASLTLVSYTRLAKRSRVARGALGTRLPPWCDRRGPRR